MQATDQGLQQGNYRRKEHERFLGKSASEWASAFWKTHATLSQLTPFHPSLIICVCDNDGLYRHRVKKAQIPHGREA
jgi:hypothetical protein